MKNSTKKMKKKRKEKKKSREKVKTKKIYEKSSRSRGNDAKECHKLCSGFAVVILF